MLISIFSILSFSLILHSQFNLVLYLNSYLCILYIELECQI